jgi:hypothetical protein
MPLRSEFRSIERFIHRQRTVRRRRFGSSHRPRKQIQYDKKRYGTRSHVTRLSGRATLN